MAVAGIGVAWCGLVVHWSHYELVGASLLVAAVALAVHRRWSPLVMALALLLAALPAGDTVRLSLGSPFLGMLPDVLVLVAVAAGAVACLLWWRRAEAGAPKSLAWCIAPGALAGLLWVLHDAPRGLHPVLAADSVIAAGFIATFVALLRGDGVESA